MNNGFTFVLRDGQRVRLYFDAPAIDEIESYFDTPAVFIGNKADMYLRVGNCAEIIRMAQKGTSLNRQEILAQFPIERLGEFLLGLFGILGDLYDPGLLPEQMK